MVGILQTTKTLTMATTDSIKQIMKELDSHSPLLPSRPNGFVLSLLGISTYLVTADRIVMPSEEEFVRSFLRDTFGRHVEQEYYPLFQQMVARFKQEPRERLAPKVRYCCKYIAGSMPPEEIPLVIKYLDQLALADASSSADEWAAVEELTAWIQK